VNSHADMLAALRLARTGVYGWHDVVVAAIAKATEGVA
jgi:hypothetical protein